VTTPVSQSSSSTIPELQGEPAEKGTEELGRKRERDELLVELQKAKDALEMKETVSPILL
jgi:hypothetical protein